MAAKIKDILIGVNQGSQKKTEFRLRILEEIINNCISIITPALCNAMISLVPSIYQIWSINKII